MTMTTSPDQSVKAPIRWTSLLQLVLSAFAAFLLFAAAGIFAISGLTQYLTQGYDPSSFTQAFMIAGSLVFAGALVLPSAWYAWRDIAYPAVEPISRPEPRNYGLVLTIIVFIATGLALLAGNFIAQNEQIAWLLLPPLNIIVSGLPALWLIYFGTRGLLPPSPRHKWGVFASGLVLGPFIILVIELIMLIAVGILVILWLMQTDSILASQLNSQLLRLRSSANDPQAILNLLMPYLLNPGVIFIGFSFVAVLVPIIEETFKPIGVWFMAGKRLNPAQGFGFGILSGAGFGLFENLGNTSGAGTGWALLAGSRISTLLLHSFTAGLVGWGLASAWSQRRFLRLALSFTIAVLIHGLWNGMAVLSAAASLPGQTSLPLPSWLEPLGSVATFGIFALGLVVVFGFFGFNAYLRRSLHTSIPPTAGDDSPLNPPAPSQPDAWSPDSPQPDQNTADSSPSQPGKINPQDDIEPNHLDSGGNSLTKMDFDA
jgi:hypothetical protein